MAKPAFQHPLDTPAGRHERAVWTFQAAQQEGLLVSSVFTFLQEKGLTQAEILAALNAATAGTLLRTALGGR